MYLTSFIFPFFMSIPYTLKMDILTQSLVGSTSDKQREEKEEDYATDLIKVVHVAEKPL